MKHQDFLIQQYIDAFEYCSVYVIGPQDKEPVQIACSKAISIKVDDKQTAKWQRLAFHSRFWCSSHCKAKAIEADTNRELRSKLSRSGWLNVSAELARAVIRKVAAASNITLTPHSLVIERAEQAIARVEEILIGMQQRGEMRQINETYKNYRMKFEASADRRRGEARAMNYDQFFLRYKVNFLRQLAFAMKERRPNAENKEPMSADLAEISKAE